MSGNTEEASAAPLISNMLAKDFSCMLRAWPTELINGTKHDDQRYMLMHMQKFSSTEVVPKIYLVIYMACATAGKQGILSCQTYQIKSCKQTIT